MIIRPATPADVPAVLPMVAKICALHESWDSAKYGFLPNPELRYDRWLTKLATDDRSVFLVAQTEGTDNTVRLTSPPLSSREWGLEGLGLSYPNSIEATAPKPLPILIAFLIATVEREIPIYRLKEFAFIHDIWVEPEYRHAGIARQIVIQAVELFSKMEVKQIRLDTATPNEAARGLFSSCGFRLSTMEMLIELE
ncbi:GNAT family N-acetyltransferase [Argonema galeatum]|uniref:GNAT family N-acetyltransferase n=1 Tax=Argonema galeatum TaxID=2942762 RepID=UPI0020129D86|nr:GNAT family N-acetyltransferase [Argonema galeatum]MCL1465993.1 GNAT family N-acetyltransferase [Argonema galeatum A003/A1]